MSPVAIGIDIGGTGIKAAAVDLEAGDLAGERVRIPTPNPPTPDAVMETAAKTIAGLPADAAVGVGFPGAFVDGEVMESPNMDPGWIGLNARDAFTERFGRPATLLNDADAAGVAEVRFGAGKGVKGVVLVLTLGTGIGSALFTDGHLVPNTEIGHIELRGKDAELRAAASVRKRKDLSWKRWAKRLNEYLDAVDRLFWPDLIILGGGVSKKPEKFVPHLDVRAPVEPAQLANRAGIVGAAFRAADLAGPPQPRRRAPARSRRR
ncbi:MAG: polyphosphate--glucose phosphotransferase [Miltoncostaeaceae bacterium]